MLLGTPLFPGGFRACKVLQVARETGWPLGLRTKLLPCGGRVGGLEFFDNFVWNWLLRIRLLVGGVFWGVLFENSTVC